MSYEQALRAHDMMLMNPPVIDAPDEPCDGCRNDLGDTAVKIKIGGYEHFYCQDCATTVERCDQCHCIRCECES